MRRKPSRRRSGLPLLAAPIVALLLSACGNDGPDKDALDEPSTGGTSARVTETPAAPDTASPQSPVSNLPADPAPDTGSMVDEAFEAARIAALQSALRYVDPALGAPEDIAKADAQCVDIQRNVANPDQVAARRFSTANHRVTEADGKRINTILSNTYCRSTGSGP